MILDSLESIREVLWTRNPISPFPEEITLPEHYLPEELISDDVGVHEYDQHIVWEVEEEIVSTTLDPSIRCKKESSEKICWQEIDEEKGRIEDRCQERDRTIDDTIDKY